MTSHVIFDLGGVLVELGGMGEFQSLIRAESTDDVWQRWLSSPAVRSFERGRCTSVEFAESAVHEFGLELTPEAFLGRFRDWPRGLMADAEALVRSVRDGVEVACFSNTNALHWEQQIDAERLHELFPRRFLSHEMGKIKPDREAFEHLVEELGCPALDVLFLDDNEINVNGARSVGLDAHHVAGVAPARALLAARGLLS